MSAKKPELLGVGRDGEDRVVVSIIYRGLKGEPIDFIHMTKDDALFHATNMLNAAVNPKGYVR